MTHSLKKLLFVVLLTLCVLPVLAQSPREVITPDNAADLRPIARLGTPLNVQRIAWAPQGARLAVAADIGVFVYEWSGNNPHLVQTLNTKLPMANVAYSPDGKILAASRNPTAALWMWNADSGKLIATYKLAGLLGFVNGGTQIALQTADGIDLWGVPGDQPISAENAFRLRSVASIKGLDAQQVGSVLAISPDGNWIAFAGQKDYDHSVYTVRLWSLATRKMVWSQQYDPEGPSHNDSFVKYYKALQFSPNSQQLAVHEGNGIRLLSVTDGTTQALLVTTPPDKLAAYMAFSPDGRVLVETTEVGGSDPGIIMRAWDPVNHTYLGDIFNNHTYYQHLSFSPDGTVLASLYPFPPYSVVVFSLHPLDPTPTPAPTVAVTAAPVSLRVGMFAVVQTTEGDTLNLRAEPNRSAAVVAKLTNGTSVTIIDGPQDADGLRWWKIRTRDGAEGWVVDQVDQIQTLVPAS